MNVMAATNKMGRSRFVLPGRYAVTVECADDLTDDELNTMEASFQAEVFRLQQPVDEHDPAIIPIAVEYVIGPNVLFPAAIDAEFLERFPRTCILGRETCGNELHIDFDNGQHVARWTHKRGHYTGHSEILSDDDAAAVRAEWLRRQETAASGVDGAL